MFIRKRGSNLLASATSDTFHRVIQSSSNWKGDDLIVQKSYLAQIKAYNIRQASLLPGKAALLIIDMQSYFEALAQPIVDNVISLIEHSKENDGKIFFTRHGHHDPKKDGGMLARWWGDLILYGSSDWELIEGLPIHAGDTIIDKNRYSAFFATELDDLLRKEGIEDLVITGVLSNCCCETTARDAFMRDYRVFFAADATAAPTEELHLATLRNLAYGFAYIVNTKDLCIKLKK